eukprot:SAG31_NODE_116_length_24094_cov_38.884184_11_plen_227_part_00
MHILFPFFQQMVDAYSKVLVPERTLPDMLSAANNTIPVILNRCIYKFEYQRNKEREDAIKAAAEEDERTAMQLIDWHDFVIVETLTFTEDGGDCAIPLSSQDLMEKINRGQEQEVIVQELPPPPSTNGDPAEGAMEVIEQEEAPAQPPMAVVTAPGAKETEIKIRRDYQGPTSETHGSKTTTDSSMFLDPITGQQIRMSEVRKVASTISALNTVLKTLAMDRYRST